MLFVTVLTEVKTDPYNSYNPEIEIDCGDGTDVEYVKVNVSGINVPSSAYVLENNSIPYYMDRPSL